MRSALYKKNLAWAAQSILADPDIFKRKAQNPDPKLLWVGCSDNPWASLETAAFADEGCIVHRNMGHQVSAHDGNFLATLAYALQTAQVERIVVCGHYGCNCLRGILREALHGAGDAWLSPVRSLHRQNRRQIDEIISEDGQIQTLCELNVRMQVRHLAELPLVEARLAVGSLKIEGVMWSVRDGLLRDPGIIMARAARALKPDRSQRRS